jgi:hypothetical protein
MYTSQVMGEVEVLATTRLATAKVPDETVVTVDPPVLMFLTAYDTFV